MTLELATEDTQDSEGHRGLETGPNHCEDTEDSEETDLITEDAEDSEGGDQFTIAADAVAQVDYTLKLINNTRCLWLKLGG